MKTIVAGVLVLAGLVIAAFAVSPADQGKDGNQIAQPMVQDEQNTQEAAPESAEDQAEERYMYFQMTTSMGEIFLELDNEKAPISTQNFLAYTEAGHYDGTIFHRVISTFMIQGGAFLPNMDKKPVFDAIENEWTNGLSNLRGTIAMARLGGRANSATSQFFINVQDNKGLDMPRDGSGYAVFGKVVRGMDVVDKIRVVPTTRKHGHADVPEEAVVIEKVVLLTGEQVEELGLVEVED